MEKQHHNTVTKRFFSKHQVENFVHELRDTHWNSVYTSSSVDDKYTEFTNTFYSAFEKAFPLERKRLKTGKSHKQKWYTQELEEMASQVLISLAELKRSGYGEPAKRTYKQLLFNYRVQLEKARQNYLIRIMKTAKNKAKVGWNFIHHNENKIH
jgi:hypothetical protein